MTQSLRLFIACKGRGAGNPWSGGSVSISWRASYIASDPRFELVAPGSRPKLQHGQMTMIYECLERLGAPPLSRLVTCCEGRGYRNLMKSEPNIQESILYHLKRMQEGTLGKVKGAQRAVIREV